MTEANDWYWAAGNDGPARDRFVIANGKTVLWARVRSEIDRKEDCAWMPVHSGHPQPRLEDILDMMFTVVPTFGVNRNRFVLEAAAIPVFARFLHDARYDLPNYVSNPGYADETIQVERYDENVVRRLSAVISGTLGVEDEWA